MEWAPLVLQRLPGRLEEAEDRELAAALGAEAGQSPTLYIYGFYDWIDVHLEMVGSPVPPGGDHGLLSVDGRAGGRASGL